jgi:hypothetical protein
MQAPTPIRNQRPHGTAKATLELDAGAPHGARGTIYLFTDMPPAGKGWVYPGFARTGGEVVFERGSGRFPTGRAQWVQQTRRALADAGHPDQFGPGRITVHANPLHGTGEAEAAFDGPETFLAAIEDAFAAAGWTMAGTAAPWQLPAAWRAVARPGDEPEPAAGPETFEEAVAAGLVDEGDAPRLAAPAKPSAQQDIPALLRQLAGAITDTLG